MSLTKTIPNVVSIYPEDSQRQHGLQFADNICSVLRRYKSEDDMYFSSEKEEEFQRAWSYIKDKLDKEYNKKLSAADTDKKKQNALNKYNNDVEKLANIVDSHKDTLTNLVNCLNSAANIKMLM